MFAVPFTASLEPTFDEMYHIDDAECALLLSV